MDSSSLDLIVAIVGGISVYVVGELIQSLVIKPLTRYNDLRSEVCSVLIRYANIFSNPWDVVSSDNIPSIVSEASNELREAACKVEAYRQEYKFAAKLFVPKSKDLKDARGWLIGLSNNLSYSSRYEEHCYTQNRVWSNAIRMYMRLEVESYLGLEKVVDKRRQKKVRRKLKNR